MPRLAKHHRAMSSRTDHPRSNSVDRHAWLGLLVVLGPVLLVSMDGSVLFLAMPEVASAVSPSADQALWILDIYGFVVGSLLIAFGSIGDRYGRLRLLLVGATLFGIGSTAAALSASAEMLIASRALMGLGGATLLPSGLAVLSELFTDPRQRARAIGIFAATFATGFAIGPILGAVLLDSFWWGSVFLINLPVVLIFLTAAPVVLREVRSTGPGHIDALSVALSALGLLAIAYAIKHVAAYGTTPVTAISAVLGIILLTSFIRRQRGLDHPLIDLMLFRERAFTVAILTGLLSLVAWSASAYLSATYLQSVLDYSVLVAGMLVLPGAAVLTTSCIVTPSVVERVGRRTSLVACHAFMAVGLVLLLFTGPTHGVEWFIASAVVAGVGYGISFSLVAETAVAAVPTERAGSAAALAETSNEIGNALGIALLGSLAAFVFRTNGPDQAGTLTETLHIQGLNTEVVQDAKSAFVDGLHAAGLVAGLLCTLLALLAIRWIPASGMANSDDLVSRDAAPTDAARAPGTPEARTPTH